MTEQHWHFAPYKHGWGVFYGWNREPLAWFESPTVAAECAVYMEIHAQQASNQTSNKAGLHQAPNPRPYGR